MVVEGTGRVPRLADHEQRRRQITDAARRVIARDGLQSATFQSVAAEAEVSVRLVQYYFGTKRDVLLATREAVAADAGERFAARLAELGEDAAPRDVIRAVLVEVLPTDDRRRADTVVLDTFFMDAVTGAAPARPEASSDDAGGAAAYLADLVAGALRRGHRAETATLDARLIVAAAGGLAQTMLVDAAAVDQADELLDRLLDLMVGS